ncbi:MAG: Holliday junction resolvase RuvX [Armatimonadota bacterium]
MRLLGVDYGLKRIGLAVGESEVGMAFPRRLLLSKGSVKADAAALAAIVQQESFDAVVLGLPLTASGDEGEQAAICRRLANALENLGVRVHLVDERMTTQSAQQALGGTKASIRKGLVDSEAARQITQSFLDSQP